jgi:aminoglycoside phosphotransferase (APT) family kinase protein
VTTAQVVELIREHSALDLRLVGSFAGGEVGAADVREPDGKRYVLKWWPEADDLQEALRSAALVDRLHQCGYPVPRYPLVDVVGGVTVMVQEHLDGVAGDDISDAVVDELLLLNQLQATAGDDQADWGEYLVSSLVKGCEGYCVHKPLRDYDARTASLLGEIERIGRAAVAERFPVGDIVHVDFHHRNVLVRAGRVGAVVDWEGCRSGDCAFDLVTLAVGLSVARVSKQARERTWQSVCDRTSRDVRRAYVAHMALRQVDWSIRHRTAKDVDHWLAVAGELLGRA